MRLEDLLIEVRSSDLRRVGAILNKHVEFNAHIRHNDVGEWTLTLPGSHPLAPSLTTPGAGIVVSDVRAGVVLMSGPMTSSKEVEDIEGGNVQSVSISGTTDEVLLSDRLAYTDPLVEDMNDAENIYDVRTGPAEMLLRDFVAANAGNVAIPSRRDPHLTFDEYRGRGSHMTKEVRYTPLLELCQEIAQVDKLGFRIVQRGDVKVFETRQTQDRRLGVRLSVLNKRLKSTTVQIEPPGVTQVVVAAQDNKAGYVPVTNDIASDEERRWGRRIERFATGNSRHSTELVQVGTDLLLEEGFTNISAQALALDHEQSQLGIDWDLGDTVTVEVGNTELASQVTGFIVSLDKASGIRVGMVLGDASGFNLTDMMVKRIEEANRRLAALERVPPVQAGGIVAPESKTFAFSAPSTSWVCQHGFNQSRVNVSTQDSNGDEVFGDVVYVNGDVVTINWYYPTAGSAIITR